MTPGTQVVYCQICSNLFATDFSLGKNLSRCCSVQCNEELEWRELLAETKNDYYPKPFDVSPMVGGATGYFKQQIYSMNFDIPVKIYTEEGDLLF